MLTLLHSFKMPALIGDCRKSRDAIGDVYAAALMLMAQRLSSLPQSSGSGHMLTTTAKSYPGAEVGLSANHHCIALQVGVYVGCCGSEIHAQWLSNVPEITGYEQTGCTLSMFANRLSFSFDFRGPSKAVDTGN